MSDDIKFLIEQEHIDYMKQVIKESPVLLPTLKLQIISLVRFMREVGYDPVDPETPVLFRKREIDKNFPREIGINKAITLHNTGGFYKENRWEHVFYVAKHPHMFKPDLILHEAVKKKVVKFIYLQWSKKRKEWVVNKHRIEFMEE